MNPAAIGLVLFIITIIMVTLGILFSGGNNDNKDQKEEINKQVEEIKAAATNGESAQPALNDQTLALLVEINNRLKEQGSLTIVKIIAILEVIVFAIWAIVAVVGGCAMARM
jgi:hypothetical protein